MTQVAPFFTELESYIAESRRVVASGEELSLMGLDEKIDGLCSLILALSQEERLMYEDRLQDLLGGLNALGNEMRVQFGQPQEIPKHRRASVAYRVADSRDNFGKRDEE